LTLKNNIISAKKLKIAAKVGLIHQKSIKIKIKNEIYA
jgi:hypothetical protein